MMFFTHLELRNSSWNECKFYRVVVVDNQIMSSWGRCGAQGQRKVETFLSHDLAKKKAYSKLTSKQNKGYSYVLSGEDISFKEPLGESSFEKIEDIVQAKAWSHRGATALNAFESESSLQVVVFNSWSLWDKGWRWRNVLKQKIVQDQPSFLNKEKDQLLTVLSTELVELLTSPQVSSLSPVDSSQLDVLEIAAQLWFSAPKDSEYGDFRLSLEAALLLK